MKFTAAILSLGFALSAVATPTVEERGPSVVERDLATITGVLNMVQQKTTALDTAVKSYNGGSVSSLQSASDSLVSTINSGITMVKGSGMLSGNDAISLIGPTQTLTTDVKNSINDLIAKKSAFVSACQGAAVLRDLNQQKTAASALSAAIVSKVPMSLQNTANSLSAGIAMNIQRGITAFTGTDNSDCSSSSSAAASSTKASSSSSMAASSSSSMAASSSSSMMMSSSSMAASSTPVMMSSSVAASSTPVAMSSAASSPLPSVTSNAAASMKSVSAPAGIVAAIAAILAF